MTNSKTLRDTSDFLASITKKSVNTPSYMEVIYYVLTVDLGLNLKDVFELPIPYIMGLLKVHHYVKEKEDREMSKSRKKQNGK